MNGASAPERHLVLVGLMGTGKSTVGRAVAERLGRSFVDTDIEIERRSGRSVRELFGDEGEAGFRDRETEVLLDLLGGDEPLVIACGGGIVLRDVNRTALRGCRARIVWLAADPSVLVERVRGAGHRPALDDDPEGTLRRMAEDRESLYREVAHAIVRTDGRGLHEVVEAVLR
mgnify:CR=1 FL=1